MADVPAVPEPTEEEVFEFLDELRESGRTNMFGASQYIESEFDLAPERAKELLASWMNTHNYTWLEVRDEAGLVVYSCDVCGEQDDRPLSWRECEHCQLNYCPQCSKSLETRKRLLIINQRLCRHCGGGLVDRSVGHDNL